MFELYLIDVGADRLGVMKILRATLGVAAAVAKELVSVDAPMLCRGTKSQLEVVQNQLAIAGASTRVVFNPGSAEIANWIPDSLSRDKTHCATCNAKLFFAIPGQTTPDEIRQFAGLSSLPESEEIASTGWIHPGVYCPNGCGMVRVNVDG